MKFHKSFIILFAFLLSAISHQLLANNSVSYLLLDSGNVAYTKGNFAGAIKFYNQFLNNGIESEEGYYNIGNCYYRLNDIPHAILNYEKALRLSPGDPDIQFNIQLANQRITDRIVGEGNIFLVSGWHNFLDSFSEKGWSLLTIAALCLSLLLFGFYFVSGRILLRQLCFWSGLIMFVASVFTFAFAIQQYRVLSTHDTAIVMTTTVTLKAAPVDNSSQLFVIHEGTKVWTVKSNGDWTEVKLANGNRGWLHSADHTDLGGELIRHRSYHLKQYGNDSYYQQYMY